MIVNSEESILVSLLGWSDKISIGFYYVESI
jgi:hypothetical protein